MRDYYEILENDLLCGGPSPIYRLTVAAEDIASEAEPGRFVNIYPPGGDLLLPRPIGIADVNGERVTFIFAAGGEGTKRIAALQPGGRAEVMGPLGTGFFDYEGSLLRMGAAETQGRGGKQTVYLIGGGTGIPPLLYAAHRLRQKRHGTTTILAFLGFPGQPWISGEFVRHCDRAYFASEASLRDALGWIGAQEIHRGNVIDLLDASLGEGGPPGADSAPQTQTLALCCGPKPMMAAAAAWCAARGIELRVSLEERMGCGYGACAGCTCRTRPVSGKPSSGPTIAGPDGTVKKKICAHGPVFWGDEVVWDA